MDTDRSEGRRNVAVAALVALVALGMVAAMFWFMTVLQAPAAATALTPVAAAPSTTAASPAPQETPTTTITVPPLPTFTPSTTVSLPPPEQPTMTAPVPGETADDDPATATAPAPAPAPSPVPAPPAPTTPTRSNPSPTAGPSVGGLGLTCSRDGGRVTTATVTFTTTAKVDVLVSGGGAVTRQQAGPGQVSLAATGRGPQICLARVGNQVVGPIPAS